MSAPPTTYGGYLALDMILGAQHVRSDAHDELLFIVIHQASELWIKLCLHELTAAEADIDADRLRPAFKHLARVARIQEQLLQSWDVLGTMTPWDYSRIRPHLGPSSGLQSHQYRLMEAMLGARGEAWLKMHAGTPGGDALAAAMAAPSLYDRVIALLARRGFMLRAELLARDVGVAHVRDDEVEAAWLTVYQDIDTHWDLYELAEKLVDFEMRFQQWRFTHLRTVERIIGAKTGTGGTAGVSYLARVLDQRFFPELTAVRTRL